MDGKGRAVGPQGLQPEGEEDQDVEDRLFDDPFSALVKNCNMLHNIVGPACVFLCRRSKERSEVRNMWSHCSGCITKLIFDTTERGAL